MEVKVKKEGVTLWRGQHGAAVWAVEVGQVGLVHLLLLLHAGLLPVDAQTHLGHLLLQLRQRGPLYNNWPISAICR